MSSTWHLQRNGKIVDPLTSDQLKHLAVTKQIAPASLVQPAAGGNWVTARNIKGLFAETPAGTDPPPIRDQPNRRSPTTHASMTTLPDKNGAGKTPTENSDAIHHDADAIDDLAVAVLAAKPDHDSKPNNARRKPQVTLSFLTIRCWQTQSLTTTILEKHHQHPFTATSSEPLQLHQLPPKKGLAKALSPMLMLSNAAIFRS